MFGFVIISIMLIAFNVAFVAKWKKMSQNGSIRKGTVFVLSVTSVIFTLTMIYNIYNTIYKAP